MDKERIKGGAQKVTGTIKEKVGQLTGDRQTEAEGVAEKAEGHVRSAVGKEITTIEALAEHPLQKAWADLNVAQCGYCQVGQIMQAASLLKIKPKPTDQDIDAAMAGNICRCGTYQRIRAAIKSAAGVKA